MQSEVCRRSSSKKRERQREGSWESKDKTEENGDGWSRIRGETLAKEERRVNKSLTRGIPEIDTATNKPNFPQQKIDEPH